MVIGRSCRTDAQSRLAASRSLWFQRRARASQSGIVPGGCSRLCQVSDQTCCLQRLPLSARGKGETWSICRVFVHAEESVQAGGQPGPINGLGAVDVLIFCCQDSSKLESMLDDSYWAPGIDAQGSRPVLVQRWHVEHRALHSSPVFGRRGSALSAAIRSMGGVHAQHYSLSDIGVGRPYRICNECQCATGQYLRLGT